MAQFVKGMHYAELEAIKGIPAIEIKQYGLDCFIVNEPTQRDIDAARHGLEEVKRIVREEACDLLILDELCIALHYHLFPLDEVLTLLREKPGEMEIVITGRYAARELYDIADLVTEMMEVKHYYRNGVEARSGIEF